MSIRVYGSPAQISLTPNQRIDQRNGDEYVVEYEEGYCYVGSPLSLV